MSKWLDHLEALRVLEEASQEPPLPARLRATTPEPPTAPDVVQALRQTILQARDWQDLEKALAHVQAAFEAGEFPQEQAEELAELAAQEGKCLPEEAGDLWLSDLFKRGPVHRCRSRLLGEDMLFTADGAQIPPGNALVVYRDSELRQMAGRTSAEVRAIHTVKRALDGEVMKEDVSTRT